MANVNRLKKKVLRQAVQDNLDTLSGAPRRSRGRSGRPSGRLLALRYTLLAVVPLMALGTSTYVLSTASAPQDRPIIVTQIFEPAPVVEPEVEAEMLFLHRPAPEPIEPAVLSLGVRRIVLDPGHGGPNLGTVAPGGLKEKDLTLDVSRRLARLLERSSFEVLMTREEDSQVDLQERTEFAKANRADIFVSIHVNWIEAQEVRGVETYYLGPTDDPYIKSIAAAENRGSGYSLADFRSLLDGLYTDLRQDESRRLAEALQGQLFESLHTVTPALRNRGVKTAPFVVLVSSDMPAALVEVACLSNQDEARLLAKPYYRQFIAQALFEGIRRYADSLAPDEAASGREETL